MREKFAKIFVAAAILHQHRQNNTVFHRQFGAKNWPNAVFARGYRETLRAVNTIAIEQRHRRHFQRSRGRGKMFRKRSSAQKTKSAAGM